MRKRPTIKTRCVASHYAAPNERIVEVSSANGGALISISALPNGEVLVCVYCADHTVILAPCGYK